MGKQYLIEDLLKICCMTMFAGRPKFAEFVLVSVGVRPVRAHGAAPHLPGQ